jgi:hypothetical protein
MSALSEAEARWIHRALLYPLPSGAPLVKGDKGEKYLCITELIAAENNIFCLPYQGRCAERSRSAVGSRSPLSFGTSFHPILRTDRGNHQKGER